MGAFYNDIDPFCVGVLRRRIADGSLPAGEVVARDVREVAATDISGCGQTHLFAGIGGFALAARWAGLPDDFDIITGGFPCQPFSVAGSQKAQSDERHLWPEMLRLVRGRRPAWVVGENVPGLDSKRHLALDGVLADLEGAGYRVGAFEIPACGVNAPHWRKRLWIVGERIGPLADARRVAGEPTETRRGGGLKGVAAPERGQQQDSAGRSQQNGARDCGSLGHTNSWDDCGWITGPDGKSRRVKPGVRLLAHGVSERVARLRSLGNAIVPQVAAPLLAAIVAASGGKNDFQLGSGG